MHRTVPTGYDDDFALWAQEQAAALREGRMADLDVANLTEEIDSLSRSERHALLSRLVKIELHLLKLTYQPEKAAPSWRGTVREKARKIRRLLKISPSLRREITPFSADAYPDAREQASDETGLPLATFPESPSPAFERALNAALAGDDFTF